MDFRNMKFATGSLIILFLMLLLITYSTSNYFNPITGTLIGLLFMVVSFMIYMRYIALIFHGVNRMDPNQRGQFAKKQEDSLFTVAIFITLFFVFFGIARWITAMDGLSLLIAGFLVFTSYQVMYFYAGKGMREELNKKQRRHNQFVQAISDTQLKCMSCLYKMREGERYCTRCGFDNQKFRPKRIGNTQSG